MSSKAIVALIAAGGVLATTPFYLSGFFAHKTMSQQMHDALNQIGTEAISITNEFTELGLYKSSYSYDLVFNLESVDLAPFKELVGESTTSIRIDHSFNHGFLSIDGDLTYSGHLVDLITEKAKTAQFTKADENKPLTETKLQADFSLIGHFQMHITSNTQAFSLVGEAEGSLTTFKFEPQITEIVGTPEKINASYDLAKIEIIGDINQTSINNIKGIGSSRLYFDRNLEQLVWQDQQFDLSLDNIAISEAGNQQNILENLLLTYLIHVDSNKRLHADVTYKFDKAGLTAMPMSQVENFELTIDTEVGYKAMKDYYENFKKITDPTDPSNPDLAIDIFSKLLAEDILIAIKSLKTKTFAGPIDLTGDVDFKALDPAEFKQNPMLAVANLSYKLKGELPVDLVNMIGQIPPEAIDNLVQQEMLTIKDGQLLIDLNGEAGHVNLNGKPLM